MVNVLFNLVSVMRSILDSMFVRNSVQSKAELSTLLIDVFRDFPHSLQTDL
jgi:hypothetical protein